MEGTPFSVVYFSRGTLPTKKGVRKETTGRPRYGPPDSTKRWVCLLGVQGKPRELSTNQLEFNKGKDWMLLARDPPPCFS